MFGSLILALVLALAPAVFYGAVLLVSALAADASETQVSKLFRSGEMRLQRYLASAAAWSFPMTGGLAVIMIFHAEFAFGPLAWILAVTTTIKFLVNCLIGDRKR